MEDPWRRLMIYWAAPPGCDESPADAHQESFWSYLFDAPIAFTEQTDETGSTGRAEHAYYDGRASFIGSALFDYSLGLAANTVDEGTEGDHANANFDMMQANEDYNFEQSGAIIIPDSDMGGADAGAFAAVGAAESGFADAGAQSGE